MMVRTSFCHKISPQTIETFDIWGFHTLQWLQVSWPAFLMMMMMMMMTMMNEKFFLKHISCFWSRTVLPRFTLCLRSQIIVSHVCPILHSSIFTDAFDRFSLNSDEKCDPTAGFGCALCLRHAFCFFRQLGTFDYLTDVLIKFANMQNHHKKIVSRRGRSSLLLLFHKVPPSLYI